MTSPPDTDKIPSAKAYLGQIPPKPGDAPRIFLDGITERITISEDGKDIYFTDGAGTKYYEFSAGKWGSPSPFPGNCVRPALSPDGLTILFEDGWYSKTSGTGWSVPSKLWDTSKKIHYPQVTNAGNYYATSDAVSSSKGDFSQFVGTGSDVVVKSLGAPPNAHENGTDFFIARDESYIIFPKLASPTDGNLYISYRKPDGGWTTPKNVGPGVNTAAWEYGPYVSPDNRYLFFSRWAPGSPKGATYWWNIEDLLKSPGA